MRMVLSTVMGVSDADEVVDEIVDDKVMEVGKSGEVRDETEVTELGAALVEETGAGTERTSDC